MPADYHRLIEITTETIAPTALVALGAEWGPPITPKQAMPVFLVAACVLGALYYKQGVAKPGGNTVQACSSGLKRSVIVCVLALALYLGVQSIGVEREGETFIYKGLATSKAFDAAKTFKESARHGYHPTDIKIIATMKDDDQTYAYKYTNIITIMLIWLAFLVVLAAGTCASYYASAVFSPP